MELDSSFFVLIFIAFGLRGMNVIKAKLTDRWGREALTEIKIYVNK